MSAGKETEWQRRKRRDSERAALIAEHGNVCMICGRPPKRLGLQVDHDHRTNETRGVLCVRCNRLLPSWVDAAWLLSAAVYLDGRNMKGTLVTYVEDYLSGRRS